MTKMTRISSHGDSLGHRRNRYLIHKKTNGDTEGEGEGEREVIDGDNKESQAAVDRVLKKHEKTQVTGGDEGGGFNAWYERSVKEKMD